MRTGLPGAADRISLNYYEPAADLRDLVSSYYLFSADIPHFADVMRADLGQLRFMLRGSGTYTLGGKAYETAEVCLLGPSNAATSFEVAGPLLVFGIGLHPAGWAALVRTDASLHADRATSAFQHFGAIAGEVLDSLRTASDAGAMIDMADAMIRGLKALAPEPPLRFTRITDAWLTGAQDPSVDDLVSALGISARQVERLAKRIYGAPPKLLARKYRSLRAASLIGTGQLHWTEAVGDAFFDQSHFIRDFKRFVGLTPSQFQRALPPVMRLTLQRRIVTGEIARLARIS